jgi:hypothetical protein
MVLPIVEALLGPTIQEPDRRLIAVLCSSQRAMQSPAMAVRRLLALIRTETEAEFLSCADYRMPHRTAYREPKRSGRSSADKTFPSRTTS